jgi:hypothetical protein
MQGIESLMQQYIDGNLPSDVEVVHVPRGTNFWLIDEGGTRIEIKRYRDMSGNTMGFGYREGLKYDHAVLVVET